MTFHILAQIEGARHLSLPFDRNRKVRKAAYLLLREGKTTIRNAGELISTVLFVESKCAFTKKKQPGFIPRLLYSGLLLFFVIFLLIGVS